jgi:cysteine desulfuration protein SufE
MNSDDNNRVTARQKKQVEEFAGLASWEDRYKLLIERGRHLKPMPVALHDEKFKVKGCQSQVWLHASLSSNGDVVFEADSDAMIVKGLVALLVEAYSEATPKEILKASPDFLKQLGFEGHLSPSRANGLSAMLKQILYYAQAFQALAQLRKN